MGNAKAKRDRAEERNRNYEARLQLLNGNKSEAPKSVEKIGHVETVKPKRKTGFAIKILAAMSGILGVLSHGK